ncbi:MAG: hypothetical protein HC817_04925 [Saprospiraceae bacterium]|nr:hypothetical protein [Saprospiraceae bacterium]
MDKGIQTRGYSCFTLFYACDCGSICVGSYCGEVQCETCSMEVCYDSGGDLGGGGPPDTECPNPPCESEDPCTDSPELCGGDNGGSESTEQTDPTPNDDEEDYVCTENFDFTSSDPDSDFRLEAGISGVHAIVNGITIDLPTLYFSTPYEDENHHVVMTPSQSAELAAEAINFGEHQMRNSYMNNPYLDEGVLAGVWFLATKDYFTTNRSPGFLENVKYRVGTAPEGENVRTKPYVKCRK